MAESETVNNTTIIRDAAQRTLVLERVFRADRQRVWQAWTDPAVFAQWWGPRGWQTEVRDADVRVGGSLIYGMKCVDEAQGEWYGQTSWGKMVFEVIDEPQSFVYTDYFCDEQGAINNSLPAATITIEFSQEDGATRVRSSSVFESQEGYDTVINMGVVEGASETWDRLAEILAK